MLTKEEILKLNLESYERGVKHGVKLSFESILKCLQVVERELMNISCSHEFDHSSLLLSDPPKKQCKKCNHVETV